MTHSLMVWCHKAGPPPIYYGPRMFVFASPFGMFKACSQGWGEHKQTPRKRGISQGKQSHPHHHSRFQNMTL